MNIKILQYYPEINITKDEFLKIKSDWLIKYKDRELIEEYLIKNQILNLHPELKPLDLKKEPVRSTTWDFSAEGC